MRVELYIGDLICNTFDDESVELNSSIANINDISKITTEYTKSFTVPANDNNNSLFKHYYDADIDNSFDARTKVNGRIDINGMPFKFGKWKLEKVILKKEKPDSYTINFRGNLVSLKDKFKDDKLTSLNLTAFNHLYNPTNVYNGLTTSLFSGNVVYNLFTKKRYYYNSNVLDNNISNIATSGVLWNDLKPSLKIIKIIEAIENKYNVVFSRDFFGRSEFKELFIWLNADTDTLGKPTEQLINFDSSSSAPTTAVFGFNLTTDKWKNTQDVSVNYRYGVRIVPTDNNIPYKIVVKNFGNVVAEFSYDGGDNETELTSVPMVNGTDTPFEYTFYLSCQTSITYEASVYLKKNVYTVGTPNDNIVYASENTLVDEFDVAENLPKIKIIDFLKAIFQMFKLVVIADEYDNIYINTLKDYYANGKVYDLTDYVNTERIEVERGIILNTIKLKFAEPTTILNSQFLLDTGLGYGDEQVILQDENGDLLDGESLEIELPFEQIIYENLVDLENNTRTNVIVGGIFNKELKAVNPKAHLFYNKNQDISTNQIIFSEDNQITVNFINIPMHTLGVFNPQYSTVFSEEFSEYNNQLITNTLYSNYYKEYIDSVFNIKKRNFRYVCENIPVRILTNLALNDVIKIKSRYYRINDFNFNLKTRIINFNLVNSFDNVIGTLRTLQKAFFIGSVAQTFTFYASGDFELTPGTSFITISKDRNLITFAVTENTTGAQRIGTFNITTRTDSQEIKIIQYEND